MEASIIIPVFNEVDAIGKTLNRLIDEGFSSRYEIIVVEDGSTDGTLDIVKKFPVVALQHPQNRGYGAALKTGIRAAQNERIIFFDGDGQHDPKYIDEINSHLKSSELVIGERQPGAFQVKNRVVGKRIIKKVGEYLIEQKLPDYNSGLRGVHKSTIMRMLHIMPNGYSFSTTSTLLYLKESLNVKTFGIHVSQRSGGQSKVRFFRDGFKTILLISRVIMLFNPLKIFLPASAICSAIGLGLGAYGYAEYTKIPNSSVIFCCLGFLLYFAGLLADQLSILNRKLS